jgi:hypothetical protein
MCGTFSLGILKHSNLCQQLGLSHGAHLKSSFVAAAIWGLCAGLCCRNYQMYRTLLNFLVGVTGRGFRAGAACPTDEVL